jgi:hypothetical protein
MHTDHTPKPGMPDVASRRQTTLSHRNPPRSVVARRTAILATFRTGSAALVVGARAPSRALATTQPGEYSHLQSAPSPAGAGYTPGEPLRSVAGS